MANKLTDAVNQQVSNKQKDKTAMTRASAVNKTAMTRASDVHSNAFKSASSYTISTTSGKQYTVDRNQVDWIKNRYAMDNADSYGMDDADQYAKKTGQLSYKMRSSYKNSNVDRQLAEMGLPSEKDLEKYLGAYAKWHTGGIDDVFGDNVSADAWTKVKELYKQDWEYENTAEDQMRKKRGLMPAALAAKYDDTEIDEQLKASGLPSLKTAQKYFDRYNNYTGIDALYKNVAMDWANLRLSGIKNDGNLYASEDGTEEKTGEQWYADAFFNELQRKDDNGEYVYGSILPLFKARTVTKEADPTKDYVAERGRLITADNKSAALDDDYANYTAFSYDDFDSKFGDYYDKYLKDYKLTSGQTVDEAITVLNRQDNERAEKEFYTVPKKSDAQDFVFRYQRDYPTATPEKMFDDMYDHGIEEKVIKAAKKELEKQPGADKNAINAAYAKSKKKHKEKTEEATAMSDVEAAYAQWITSNASAREGGLTPENIQAAADVLKANGQSSPEAVDKAVESVMKKQAERAAEQEKVEEEVQRVESVKASSKAMNAYIDQSIKANADEETVALAYNAIEKAMQMYMDPDEGTISPEDVIKVIHSIEEQSWNNPTAMRIALEDFGFGNNDRALSGPAAMLAIGWTPAEIKKVVNSIGPTRSDVFSDIHGVDEETSDDELAGLLAQSASTETGSGFSFMFSDNSKKYEYERFMYALEWAQQQIQSGAMNEFDAYNVLAANGFQDEMEKYMPEDWHRAIYAHERLAEAYQREGGDKLAYYEGLTDEEKYNLGLQAWDALGEEGQQETFKDYDWRYDPSIYRTGGQAFEQQFAAIIPGLAASIASTPVKYIDMIAANISGREEMWDITEDFLAAEGVITSYGAVNDSLGNGVQVASVAADVVQELARMYILGSIGGQIGEAFAGTKLGQVMTAISGSDSARKGVKVLTKVFTSIVNASPFVVSATASDYAEAKTMGASTSAATWYGVVMGTLEGVWESFEFDNLWGKVFGADKFGKAILEGGASFKNLLPVAKARVANMVLSGMGEWTEEFLGYSAETVWKMKTEWGKNERWNIADALQQANMGFLTGFFGAGLRAGSITKDQIIRDYLSGDQEVQNAVQETGMGTLVWNNASEAQRASWRSGELRVRSIDEFSDLVGQMAVVANTPAQAKDEYDKTIAKINKKYGNATAEANAKGAKATTEQTGDAALKFATAYANMTNEQALAAAERYEAKVAYENKVRNAEKQLKDLKRQFQEHYAALYLQNESQLQNANIKPVAQNVSADMQNGATVSPETVAEANAEAATEATATAPLTEAEAALPWVSKQDVAESRAARPFTDADEQRVIEAAKKIGYKGNVSFVDDPNVGWEGRITSDGNIEINRAKLTARDTQRIQDNPAMWVLEHELWHHIARDGSAASSELATTVRKIYEKHPALARGDVSANWTKFLNKVMEQRQAMGVPVNNIADAEEEVIADFFRNYAFRSDSAIKMLCDANGNLGQRILSWLRYKIDNMKLRRSKDSWARDILNVERQYALALRQANKNAKATTQQQTNTAVQNAPAATEVEAAPANVESNAEEQTTYNEAEPVTEAADEYESSPLDIDGMPTEDYDEAVFNPSEQPAELPAQEQTAVESEPVQQEQPAETPVEEAPTPVQETAATQEEAQPAPQAEAQTQQAEEPARQSTVQRYGQVTGTRRAYQSTTFSGGDLVAPDIESKINEQKRFADSWRKGRPADYARFGNVSYSGRPIDNYTYYGYSKTVFTTDSLGRSVQDGQTMLAPYEDLQSRAFENEVVRFDFLPTEDLGRAGEMSESDIMNRAPVNINPSDVFTDEQIRELEDVASKVSGIGLTSGKIVVRLPESSNFDAKARAALQLIFKGSDSIWSRSYGREKTFVTGITSNDLLHSSYGVPQLTITDKSQPKVDLPTAYEGMPVSWIDISDGEVQHEEVRQQPTQRARAQSEGTPARQNTVQRYGQIDGTRGFRQNTSFTGRINVSDAGRKMDEHKRYAQNARTGRPSDYRNFGGVSYYGRKIGDTYGYARTAYTTDSIGRSIQDGQTMMSPVNDLNGQAFVDDVVRFDFLPTEDLGRARNMSESDVTGRAPVNINPSDVFTDEQMNSLRFVGQMLGNYHRAGQGPVVVRLPISDNFDAKTRAALMTIFESMPETLRKNTDIGFLTGVTSRDIASTVGAPYNQTALFITDKSQPQTNISGVDWIDVPDGEAQHSAAGNVTENALKELGGYVPKANPKTGVTVEDDAKYMRAALAGDEATAKKMVDDVMIRNGGKPFYHGTKSKVGSWTQVLFEYFTSGQMFGSPDENIAGAYVGDENSPNVRPLEYADEQGVVNKFTNLVNTWMGTDYSVTRGNDGKWILTDNRTGDVVSTAYSPDEIVSSLEDTVSEVENVFGEEGLPDGINNPFIGGIMSLYYFPQNEARHRGFRQYYSNILSDSTIPSSYVIYDEIRLTTNADETQELYARTSNGETMTAKVDSGDVEGAFKDMFGDDSDVYDFFNEANDIKQNEDGSIILVSKEVPVSPKNHRVFKFEDYKNAGTTTDAVGLADKNAGYDSSVITNIFDGYGYPEDVIILRDGNRIKSADAITIDDDGNIIPLSERVDLGQNELRYSGGLDVGKILNEMGGEGDGSTTSSAADALVQQYGAKKQGRQPRARDIQVPERVSAERRVSDLARNVAESDKLTDAQAKEFLDDIADGAFLSYIPETDQHLIDEARAYITRRQTLDAQQDFHDMVEHRKFNKETNALGIQLLADAAARGDIASVKSIVTDLQIAATEVGQSVQIFNVLKQLKGVGSAWYMEGLVKKLNKQYDDRIKSGKMQPITVSPALMDNLSRATTIDEIAAAENAVAKDIAQQLPLTWVDRLSNWRYFSMLANPTTHFRNMTGNLFMRGMNAASDVVATGIERAFVKDESQRAHALLTSDDKAKWGAFADKSYAEQASNLRGGGKQGFASFVKQNMRDFDTKLLNRLSKWNSELLEKEDITFIKPAYRDALMQYMKAQGYTLNDDGKAGKVDSKGVFHEMTNGQMTAAVEWASTKAWEATFREANKISTWLNKMSQEFGPVGRMVVEGLMPFKKTPVNIARTGAKFSPLGIMLGAKQLMFDVKQGKMSAAKAVDNISHGITGSALMALGAFLAKLGVIRVGEDKKKLETYLEDTGDQTYAFKVWNVSVNMSAIAPATIPLFMGVALQESASRNGEGLDLSALADTLAGTLNPFMEMSFMSSLNNALKSYGNNGIGGAFGSFVSSSLQSYGSQYLPTLGGKIAQFADPTRRSTKSDATSPIGGTLDYYGRSLAKKVPGLEATLEPDVDVWGRETTKGNPLTADGFFDWALDFANKFILPVNVKVANRDAVDRELIRIVESTGNTDFLPSDGSKYFTVNNKKYKMNAKQYTEYSQERGQASYAALKEVMWSAAYRNASDEARADMLTKALEAAHKQVDTRWKDILGAFD